MRKGLTALGLCTLIFTHGCGAGDLIGQTAGGAKAGLRKVSSDRVSGDDAVKVANKDMRMTGEDPSAQEVNRCELLAGWLVIYSGGTEYVIDKNDKQILVKRHLPQGTPDSVRVRTTAADAPELDKNTAIELTTDDARQVYQSIEDYKITACELPDVWRVVYEPSGGSSGGGPHYKIDKKTRQFIFKRYYQ